MSFSDSLLLACFRRFLQGTVTAFPVPGLPFDSPGHPLTGEEKKIPVIHPF
jgi:hypothetical protein